jgi:hypothetical protein
MADPTECPRPSQLATVLLASGESLPRLRARDQQADVKGSQLKQRILRRIIDLDPEPATFLETLESIIEELGPPSGPTRALARVIADEWVCSADHPQLSQWLLQRALERAEDVQR